MKQNSKIALFEYIGALTFFLVFLLRLMGYRIVVKDVSNLVELLRKLSLFNFIHKMDFGEASSIDPLLINDDSRDYTSIVFKSLSSLEFESVWSPVIFNIKNVNRKLNILLREEIQVDLRPIFGILALREDMLMNQQVARVVLILKKSHIRKYLLKQLSIKAIFTPTFKLTGSFIRFVVSKFNIKRSSLNHKFNPANHTLRIVNETEAASYQVLFFPHMSVKYLNLFSKDHFYHADTSSLLHPANILHVEISNFYEDYFDQQALGVKELNFYRITYSLRKILQTGFRSYISVYYRLLSSDLFWCSISNMPRWFALAGIMAHSIGKYFFWIEECKTFKACKVALVGYDVLFPPPLSLALESNGIYTIAVQERLALSYMKSINMIFGTYMVASQNVCDRIKKSDNFCMERIIPVGLQRSDYIFNSASKRELIPPIHYKKTILVFDFHTEPFSDTSRFQVCNSWESNLDFYESILEIAHKFQEFTFIVRGKNLNWFEIPYFDNVRERISRQINLELSIDYSKEALQYELISSANLVIARYTSAVDEAIVSGKVVIIADYYPKASTYVDKLLDYSGLAFTARSHDELSYWVAKVLIDGSRPERLDDTSAVTQLFGPFDGRAKERIQKETANILELIL